MIDGALLACTSLYWIAWGHSFDRAYYAAVAGAVVGLGAPYRSLFRAATACWCTRPL